VIEIKDVTFSYVNESRNVLERISINVPKGGITTVLGLNGSGKTTFIKLLVNLLKPSMGTIKVNGYSIASMSIKERSKMISYVSQLTKNDHDFIVFDYLSFSLANCLGGFRAPTSKEEEKILEYANKFKIADLLSKRLSNLSGGERQIVSICGAFIQNTPIIVLDEPTSALDLKNQSIVIKAIKEWNRSKEKTIILSSHNPNHALSLGGNVILLDDSKIIKNGSVEDIITVENLKQVYGDIIDYAKNIKHNIIAIK